MPPALVWFRNDLRLSDNPALRAALDAGQAPVCIYIHEPDEEGEWPPGAASNAWRQRSLAALDADLRARGSRLRLFAGPSLPTLQTLALAFDAQAVYWNRRYEPAIERRDAAIKTRLRRQGLRAESFNGSLLFEPWELRTAAGGPYRMFAPFWRAALAQWDVAAPWDPPPRLPGIDADPEGVPLDALHLRPARGWDAGFWEWWTPGEAGARAALQVFADGALRGYREARDRPDRIGTSRLSPHLHFGEIAPWRIVAALQATRSAGARAEVDAFVRALGRREFAHHLLHHFPPGAQADRAPRRGRLGGTRAAPRAPAAWRRGRTGVPIVDAGMRELWHTGWMHERVRTIVAAFLVEHLGRHRLEGARWFWDALLDADLASNTLGWRAVAGGRRAPHARRSDPVRWAKKCDPDGAYIARWLPELSELPPPARFAPWTAAKRARSLAPRYPARPIVDPGGPRPRTPASCRAPKPPR